MSVLISGSIQPCHAQEPACMASFQTSTHTIASPEVTLLPAPEAWPAEFSTPHTEQAIQARTQLGLPTDRPIIASGHQPIAFHPGIVSKLIALDHWSKVTGAAPVWIVPDQDIVDPALIRVPIQDDGSLRTAHIRIGGESDVASPSASRAPITIRPDLPEKLESLGTWISGYEHETSLARQFASATIGMLCETLDIEEPELIYASDLLATDACMGLLDAMLDDPVRAIESYNACVDRFPDAGVRKLSLSENQIELPFWRLEGDTRVPVFVELGSESVFDRSSLIPRGITMTAIMRASICDFFIHGTGGYEYDQITEAWVSDWRGQSLATIAGATATMTLDLEIADMPDPDRVVWEAHHARHDPAMLGDPEAAEEKRALVEAIAKSKGDGDRIRRAELFAQLQRVLEDSRTKNAESLTKFANASMSAQESRELHRIATDRTWAFPLYSDVQLRSLKEAVTRALSGED